METRKLYILTDDREIIAVRAMTDAEADEAARRAALYTDKTLRWGCYDLEMPVSPRADIRKGS
jgi:hypothetical protein